MQKHYSCFKIDRKPGQTCLNSILISNPSSICELKMQGFPSALGCSQSGAVVVADGVRPLTSGRRQSNWAARFTPVPRRSQCGARAAGSQQRCRGHSGHSGQPPRSQWSVHSGHCADALRAAATRNPAHSPINDQRHGSMRGGSTQQGAHSGDGEVTARGEGLWKATRPKRPKRPKVSPHFADRRR